ncbi:MAG: TonB-dependent receptor [Chitinispirillaceae bacterium]
MKASVLLLAAGLMIPAMADSGKEEKKKETPVHELNRMNVREMDIVDLPAYERFHIPESSPGIEVLTEDEIKAMEPSDVYSVFERALGMGITRQGSRIHNWVQGRGGEKSALGIILDGVYMPATAAQRILGNLPTDMIQSIRIVRDASIVTMGPLMNPGSNSAGAANQGFIIIETKRAREDTPRLTETTLGYGSYNSLKIQAFHSQIFEDVGHFSVGYSRSQNDSKKDRFGNWNNGFEGNSFLLNGGIMFGPLSADMSIFYNQASRDIQRYQEKGEALRSAVWRYDPMNTRIASLALTGQWNDAHTTQAWVGYNDAAGTGYWDVINPETHVKELAQEPYESEDRAAEFNLLHTWTQSGNSFSNALKIGAQSILWYQQTERSEDFPSEENIYGFYLSDELGIREKITVDAGLRIDKRYIVAGGGKYTTDGVSVKNADEEWGSDAYNFSLGGTYDFSSRYSVNARAAYNHTPTPKVLSTVDNKELDPEGRIKYEAGVVADIANALSAKATGYYYDIRNAKIQGRSASGRPLAIELIDNGDTIGISLFESADRLARYGLEMEVSGRQIGPFGYDFGLTLLGSSDKEQAELVPVYKLTAGINFDYEGFSTNVNLLNVPEYTGGLDMPVGDYTIINASMGKSIGDHFSLRLYGRNITNEKYTNYYKAFPPHAETGYFYDIGAVYGVEVTVRL